MVKIDSVIGSLFVYASESGVTAVDFEERSVEFDAISRGAIAHEARAAKQLDEYFAGLRKRFELSLDLQGTEFQLQAWRVLQDIEYGATISYAEEARRMGKPRAVRAVGSANGRNPIPIIIPCHRVVASGGGLGGYAGGLDKKTQLLRLEAAAVAIA